MEKNSIEFAPQSYFDNFLKALQGSKLKFLQQVQISTEDGLQFFVPAEKARETSIVFYVPGHAMLFHMEFHEHHRDSDPNKLWVHSYNDATHGYWAMQIYMQLRRDGEDAMESLSGIMYDPKNDQILDFSSEYAWESDLRTVHKYEPQIACFRNCGWSSRGPNNNHTWNTENAGQENALDTDVIAAELVQFVDAVIHIVREGQFDEFSTGWPPTYTFCGDEREHNGEQHKKVTELYWERFGDARKVLRTLAKRIF